MFTNVRQAQENRKYARGKRTGDGNRVVCACFPDVHTGETRKMRISTRKRKIIFFLFLSLCVFHYECSRWDFPDFLCLFLFHKCEMMCAWLCFYFLSLFYVLFVARAFSYFLFARACIIVMYI